MKVELIVTDDDGKIHCSDVLLNPDDFVDNDTGVVYHKVSYQPYLHFKSKGGRDLFVRLESINK